MRKILLLLILIPVLLFADIVDEYKKEYTYLDNLLLESKVTFHVKPEHEYAFKVSLKAYSQYCFILEGNNSFHFQIIENSGSHSVCKFSRNNKLIYTKDIMDKTLYTIKIYSEKQNFITLYYGEY